MFPTSPVLVIYAQKSHITDVPCYYIDNIMQIITPVTPKNAGIGEECEVLLKNGQNPHNGI